MRASYLRRLVAPFLVLVTLAAFNCFTAAAQTASESKPGSGFRLTQSQLGQPGVKPAPFPESRRSWSFRASQRTLNFSRPKQWGADMDQNALPATGKNFTSHAYANGGLRPTPSTSPAGPKPIFDPSRLDNRKLGATAYPDLGKAQ